MKVIKLGRGKSIDVHGVIEYIAYVAGAVHMGTASTEEQKQLERFIKPQAPGNTGQFDTRLAMLHVFRSIIAVTYRAVEPLLKELLEKRRQEA